MAGPSLMRSRHMRGPCKENLITYRNIYARAFFAADDNDVSALYLLPSMPYSPS